MSHARAISALRLTIVERHAKMSQSIEEARTTIEKAHATNVSTTLIKLCYVCQSCFERCFMIELISILSIVSLSTDVAKTSAKTTIKVVRLSLIESKIIVERLDDEAKSIDETASNEAKELTESTYWKKVRALMQTSYVCDMNWSTRERSTMKWNVWNIHEISRCQVARLK